MIQRKQIVLRDLRPGDVIMDADDPDCAYGRVSAVGDTGFWYEGRRDQIPFMNLASSYVFWIEREVASRDEVIADLLRVLS